MVYESDFYTTRRPYRTTPSYSTYTVSSYPSKQVRILPGLGKVHVIHTYDRIVPYVGHKRLTVVTSPKVYSTRQSVLKREYDWIENKLRPWVAYSPTNRYLNSDSSVRIVYVRNPITGYTKYYDYDYIPSRYYNYYRVIRPLSWYDYWSYYRPLASYPYYWPSYRTLSYLDDIPVYRSLRLQRKLDSLTGYSYPYYRRWLDYDYYYRPLSLYYYRYWPSYDYYYDYLYPRYRYYYRPLWRYYRALDSWPSYYYYSYYYPGYRHYYSPLWRYYTALDTWYPKRSYYWLKYLPISYTLNSLSSKYSEYLKSIFDDETRLIRAQTASLLKQIHLPVPRIRTWQITPLNRFGDYSTIPAKFSNDTYIHRLLTVSPDSKVKYATYYTEPVKKYIGKGHLSCVSYAGGKAYDRRHPFSIFEEAVRNDIQLLSYYINKFRQEKAQPKEIEAGSVEEKQPIEITE